MSDIIVGLDVGTSAVRVAIGEVTSDGGIEIIGLSNKKSQGLRNGAIVNLEAAGAIIKDAVDCAEQNAGFEVSSCVAAIGGPQIECLNSRGQAAVSKRGKANGEITRADVERVIENARSVPIAPDKEILHVIPKSYTVDQVGGIKDPINMMGVRLETEIHIVTASRTAIQNIRDCVNRAGYDLDRIMQKTLAAAQAVVHQDEMELGSILIDLGAGTTDVLVLHNGAPLTSFSLKNCGYYVTNDIAIVKGIPPAAAEEIKIKDGCCFRDILDNPHEVAIQGVGGRPPEMTSQVEICDIIQPRMEEIFMTVRSEIVRKTDLTRLSGNIILTGGGAQMEGVLELAMNVFGTTAVRLGIPESLGGIEEDYRKPEWATAIGLVISQRDSVVQAAKNPKRKKRAGSSEGILQKLKKAFF